MESNVGSLILGAGVFVWLIALTILTIRMHSHYNRLTRGITSAGLRDVLESLMKSDQAAQSRFRSIDDSIKLLTHDGARHIQRIGIVRFNPFSDTGGAQSFSLAIVDSGDNGIVMTSLYARNGNRWYVKEIVAGRGKGVELSREEESAIKHARIIKV